jgi:protein involved in polysaccharide export with SLBB domain
MPITYGATYRAGLTLATSLFLTAHAQSLEDKVSQARKLQAQSAMNADSRELEALARERASHGRAAAGSEEDSTLIPAPMDSLIAGPQDSLLVDTASLPAYGKRPGRKDSTGVLRRRFAALMPKRYEQRIFRNLDRSAFSSSKSAVGRDYVLGPGDGVEVSLWGDKEREYHLVLNNEGKVFLEGVGLVQVGGMNLNEARDRIKERLSKIYSGIARGTAHVDVSLGKAGPIKVFVLGEVKVPGGYVFTGNTSVLSAMYFAQGPTDIGTVRNLQLTRDGKKYPLDLYQYLIYGQTLTPDVLQDGDVLFARRADILVEIGGDVGRAATYELKKGEGVKELLEFAGRLNATAATHKMTLQRLSSGGKPNYMDLASPQDYLSGKAKVELQDGDRVLVEKSTELTTNFATVTGPVKYPGTYSIDGVANVGDLIAKAGGLREDAFLGRAHVVRFNVDGSSKLFASGLGEQEIRAIALQPRDNVILYSVKDMYLPDSVEVEGAVFNPGKYEFREGMTAKDLVMQAGGFLPEHEPGKLLVFRDEERDGKVDQMMLNVEEGLATSGESFTLKRRDLVQVPLDPKWYRKEVVSLSGLFVHPGKYALLYPGERLATVIERAGGFKSDAYVEGGRFFRTKDSVGRVGVDIRKAVDRPHNKVNISMVGGDSIFIPGKMNTVKVIGEVGFETSVLFQEGAGVQYYIEKAGGFTRRSEQDRIVVQYANGETGRDGYFNRKPDAGSVIYVPQGPEPQSFNWVQGINAILGTLSLAAALLLTISNLSSK